MILYPSFSCTTTWFQKKRALAMGIVASGSSMGGVILPIMVNRLIPIIGFGWTMRICAFLMLGLLVITNLTVRSRLRPQPKKYDARALIKSFKDIPFLLTALAGFFYSMGMFIPITFLVTYGRSVSMSPQLAGYLVSMFNGARYVISVYFLLTSMIVKHANCFGHILVVLAVFFQDTWQTKSETSMYRFAPPACLPLWYSLYGFLVIPMQLLWLLHLCLDSVVGLIRQ